MPLYTAFPKHASIAQLKCSQLHSEGQAVDEATKMLVKDNGAILLFMREVSLIL